VKVVSEGVARKPDRRLEVLEATLSCLEDSGLGGYSVEAAAKRAGLSRVTIYRLFPGGRDELLEEATRLLVDRTISKVATAMGECDELEGALVAGMTTATRILREEPVLAKLLEESPGAVLSKVAFGELDKVLRGVSEMVAPFLGRFLAHEEALLIGELAARMVLSYVLAPGSGIDLGDEDSCMRAVVSYVLPAAYSLGSYSEVEKEVRNNASFTRRRSKERGDQRVHQGSIQLGQSKKREREVDRPRGHR
jgi:AcrR family transcriptional regulator